MTTQQKLLAAARALFWTRGYSNVSLRDITREAGVDVALVSRYFGGKQGLFEATVTTIPPWEALAAEGEDLLSAAVSSFSQPYDPETDAANPFTMLLTNCTDPEIGATLRTLVKQRLAGPLAQQIGGPEAEARAAMLLAALFGMALMRKSFQLEALAKAPAEEVEALTRHLAAAALRFGG